MLTLYRRHSPGCSHHSRNYRKCKCPLWVQGALRGIWVKKSLKLRSWEAAQELIRDWEAAGSFETPKEKDPVSAERAITSFMEDAKARGLAEATLGKYKVLLEKQLLPFSKKNGVILIRELDAESLGEFRKTWSDKPLAA